MQQDTRGNTALHLALLRSRGRGDCIELLRAAGADIDVESSYGLSPVQLARLTSNFDLARFFADVPYVPLPDSAELDRHRDAPLTADDTWLRTTLHRARV